MESCLDLLKRDEEAILSRTCSRQSHASSGYVWRRNVVILTPSTDSFPCPTVVLLNKAVDEHAHSIMTRNNHAVQPLTALGVPWLLYVVLLPGTGIVAQPVRERLPVRELTYVVESICQGESCRLLVGMTFQGDSSGKSRLLLPLRWSDGVDLYKAIRNITSLSEDVKVEDTKEPHVKIVHHRPNQRVSLTYEVVSQPPGTQLTVAVYHNPVLRPSYFYVIGHALWLYPEMPGTTPLRVTLHWKNIPTGWALINSFGVGEPRQKVKTSLNEFRKGTFLAGDYRIKRFEIKKRPVYAVTRGEWRFPDEKLNNLVQKVVQLQRDFWNSYDFPYYFVAVLPSDRRNVRGGEGRTNSFSLYLPKNLTTLYVEHDLYLFAHESFHTWNPMRLGGYENDRLYWFGEGVTDYYALLLLLRAGLISLEEYVAAHNSWIKAYYTSPVRSLTVDEMVQKRQTDWHAGQLFYKKGYLLANHLDFTIRSKTNGKHSLDDVMRSLLGSSKPGIELSEKRIANALRPYLQEQGASDIEKYMVRGELVPANNSFGACATVEDIEHRSLDVGFDFKKSFETRVVSGVVPDSNAHKAGLRDGQKIVTWNILDDPKSEAKVTIVEGATQKVLQYYPASTEAVRLPQFKLKQGLSVEERAQCLSQLGVPLAPRLTEKARRRAP
jgi:predicted metalloprotease with PDZ domain